MKYSKVCFLSHHYESSQKFLDTVIRLTPNCSGKWKNIKATTKIEEADYYWIMDGYSGKLPDAKNKAIYFGEHPYTPYSPVHKNFQGKEALLKLPLQYFLNPGEVWLTYTYDELINLQPSEKNKNLICVVTYQTHHEMYLQRIKFVSEFVKKYKECSIDVYGRPSKNFEQDRILKEVYRGVLGKENYDALKGEHLLGKNILLEYNYSLEFDVGPCVNYFSERFYDSALLWCTPIYFGCQNIDTYLPHKNKAYYTFNQNDLGDVDKVAEIVNQPKYWKELGELREVLLNKYQMWAYCHDVINNLDKYKEKQRMFGVI